MHFKDSLSHAEDIYVRLNTVLSSSQYTLGNIFFKYSISYEMDFDSSVFYSSVGKAENLEFDDGGFKPYQGRVLFSYFLAFWQEATSYYWHFW